MGMNLYEIRCFLARAEACREFLYLSGIVNDKGNERLKKSIRLWMGAKGVKIRREELGKVDITYSEKRREEVQ